MRTPEQTVPSAQVRRVRRPTWRDPRLGLGLLLVLGSVAAGGKVVAMADDSQPYYALQRTVTPGEPVGPQDVRVVQAQLGTQAGQYLSADRPLPASLVARRAGEQGELLTTLSVGSADGLDQRPVGIEVEGRLPSTVRKAALVDVWVAEADPERAGAFTAPRPLVQGAVVAELQGSSSSLGGSSATTVQVLVGSDDLPTVLAALANKGVVSVLPAATP